MKSPIDEHHAVSEVLELLHLPDQHRVAEVQIGRRRVEPHLDGERPACLESTGKPCRELVSANDIHTPTGQDFQLRTNIHQVTSRENPNARRGSICARRVGARPDGFAHR